MLEAVVFHHELRGGSSLPLVVGADDGRLYVLKARGGGDGVLAGVADWLGLALGRRLGLPFPEPVAISVAPGFVNRAKDPEIRELLEKSHGSNLATRWLDDARPPTRGDLERLDPALRRDLFLFDLLLLNVDRHERNPNAVVTAAGLRCLDLSASMALRALLGGTSLDEGAFLTELRRNPFYAADSSPEPFAARLRAVSRDDLRRLVESLPAGWLCALADPVARPALVDRLHALLRDGDVLPRRLDALRDVPFESADERYRRGMANKAEFMRRFGKI